MFFKNVSLKLSKEFWLTALKALRWILTVSRQIKYIHLKIVNIVSPIQGPYLLTTWSHDVRPQKFFEKHKKYYKMTVKWAQKYSSENKNWCQNFTISKIRALAKGYPIRPRLFGSQKSRGFEIWYTGSTQ